MNRHAGNQLLTRTQLAASAMLRHGLHREPGMYGIKRLLVS
jgi:hypothetical protein